MWKFKEDQKAYKKRWLAEVKAKGLCPCCAINPTEPNRKMCRACLDRSSESSKRRNRRLRIEVMQAYGGACVCCGETNIKFLTIDHINGGGKEHRQKFTGYNYPTGGVTFYNALKKAGWPTTEHLQILCWNCNIAKYHYGKCPHQQN